MVPVFGVWRPEQPKLLRRVHNRLSRTGGCRTVRYEPSQRDANEVVAIIDPTVFLSREYAAAEARLRVEFTLGGDRPHYWIHWWEPDSGRSIGWHCDETEPEYGPIHFQIEYTDGTTDRQSAEYIEDEHPYRRFERHLAQIDDKLINLDWKA